MGFDFNSAEKKVVDALLFGVNKHAITMAIFCGDKQQVFSMTPEDAKNMLGVFISSVKAYEDKHGPIVSNLTISPIELSQGEYGPPCICGNRGYSNIGKHLEGCPASKSL